MTEAYPPPKLDTIANELLDAIFDYLPSITLISVSYANKSLSGAGRKFLRRRHVFRDTQEYERKRRELDPATREIIGSQVEFYKDEQHIRVVSEADWDAPPEMDAVIWKTPNPEEVKSIDICYQVLRGIVAYRAEYYTVYNGIAFLLPRLTTITIQMSESEVIASHSNFRLCIQEMSQARTVTISFRGQATGCIGLCHCIGNMQHLESFVLRTEHTYTEVELQSIRLFVHKLKDKQCFKSLRIFSRAPSQDMRKLQTPDLQPSPVIKKLADDLWHLRSRLCDCARASFDFWSEQPGTKNLVHHKVDTLWPYQDTMYEREFFSVEL